MRLWSAGGRHRHGPFPSSHGGLRDCPRALRAQRPVRGEADSQGQRRTCRGSRASFLHAEGDGVLSGCLRLISTDGHLACPRSALATRGGCDACFYIEVASRQSPTPAWASTGSHTPRRGQLHPHLPGHWQLPALIPSRLRGQPCSLPDTGFQDQNDRIKIPIPTTYLVCSRTLRRLRLSVFCLEEGDAKSDFAVRRAQGRQVLCPAWPARVARDEPSAPERGPSPVPAEPGGAGPASRTARRPLKTAVESGASWGPGRQVAGEVKAWPTRWPEPTPPHLTGIHTPGTCSPCLSSGEAQPPSAPRPPS
ncbi:uncharacterized protein LOC122233097 [Panthera tigris]|uniref:uncharacterized protein LOC122233097 n=1 Tax=Panthera tigris TaxID=9694 RepID=UPI001C6F84B8|nr:uncharacterized protein LOC122233097 [Panthera tigris]